MPHLREYRLQDRVVARIALAIGPADQDTPALFLRAGRAPQDGLINFDLLADGRVDGKLARRLFIEILAELFAHRAALGQTADARAEGLGVLRMEQQPGHAVLNDVRNPADIRGDGRAVHPRALGDCVGERLRKRGQRVHVQRMVEAVHVRHPPGKHIAPLRAELRSQLFEHFALLAVARNEQPDVRVLLRRKGKAADQRRHVLHRVQPRRDAEHNIVRPGRKADAFQIRRAIHRGRPRRKIDAVVDGEHRLRVKAALDQHLAHRIGHADVIVKAAQRDRIDRAERQPMQRAAQIVEPVVAVDRRHDGHMDRPPQNRAGHVRPRAVAVDDLKALVLDHARQRADARGDAAVHHDGVDAKLPRLLRKRPVHKADQPHRLRLAQALQQRQHMRLRAAHIAAGNEMQYFHIYKPQRNFSCNLTYNTLYYTRFGLSNQRRNAIWRYHMKIIDEKGRLFGKLNLIDLLVIILLIAAVAAVAWKLVGKKAAETVADTGRTITYTVTVEDVNREAAEFASTQIGKSLVNNSKVVDAAITDAAVTDRADSAHVDLAVTIEGRGQFTGNVYKVGAQEVRVGYEYIVKTSEFELTGIITAMTVAE